MENPETEPFKTNCAAAETETQRKSQKIIHQLHQLRRPAGCSEAHIVLI